MTDETNQSAPAPGDILERLRAMPSSLNDALRTMDDAAREIEALRGTAPGEMLALEAIRKFLPRYVPDWAREIASEARYDMADDEHATYYLARWFDAVATAFAQSDSHESLKFRFADVASRLDWTDLKGVSLEEHASNIMRELKALRAQSGDYDKGFDDGVSACRAAIQVVMQGVKP